MSRETALEQAAPGQIAYSDHVNPQWSRLLSLLQMNADYVKCRREKLYTSDGRTILDFLSGYCVHNFGHNHPHVIAELHAELDRHGPAMLQSHVAATAGELAQKLCARAGGRLNKVYFANSGSEGVETAIKLPAPRRDATAYLQHVAHSTASPVVLWHSWTTASGRTALGL